MIMSLHNELARSEKGTNMGGGVAGDVHSLTDTQWKARKRQNFLEEFSFKSFKMVSDIHTNI